VAYIFYRFRIEISVFTHRQNLRNLNIRENRGAPRRAQSAMRRWFTNCCWNNDGVAIFYDANCVASVTSVFAGTNAFTDMLFPSSIFI
jgi:hypothetical protein